AIFGSWELGVPWKLVVGRWQFAPRLSEFVTETELNLARRVGQRRHLAEVGAGDRRLGRAPDGAVEQVEHLEAELEPRGAEAEGARQRDVLAEEPRPARVRVAD